MAHELNTPLAVLAGSIEKLIETNQDSHTQERLARMQRVTQRLRRISESLVDFSRVRKTQMEATALRPLIEEAWALVAIDEKSSQVEFVNQVGAEHRVIGNADRLLQVFVNLLRNALNAVSGEKNGPDRGTDAARARDGGADGGRQRARDSGVRAAGHFRCICDHAAGRAWDGTGADRGRGDHHAARRERSRRAIVRRVARV